MKQLTVLAVLSLCCTSLTSGTGDCHPEGPENCTILEHDYLHEHQTVCSWSLGSNFKKCYCQSETFRWFVRLKPENEEGKLTSRRACSTGGESHCLWFLYKLEPQDVAYLSVSIQYEETDAAESPLWITSRSYGWDYGGVQINTDRNFRVVFKANTLSNRSSEVFLDQISYVKSDHCVPHATAETVTTASTTALGVMVAVLIVILIVMAVLLVVFRGKHLQFLKACCKKKLPMEQFHMNTSHNAGNSFDAGDPGQTNGVSSNTQQSPDTNMTSTSTSVNHSPEHPLPNNPSYPVANKQRNAKAEISPKIQSNPSTATNNFCDEDAMPCQKTVGTEYQNRPPMMAKQEQYGQNNSSSPLPTVTCGYNFKQPQNSSLVYHILEKEPGTESNSVHHVPNASMPATAQGLDGEYNRLDFVTKECGKTNCFDQEKTERATGGVYSHLNEGDEDTYNEVHRENRAEVIDGVYSHIK